MIFYRRKNACFLISLLCMNLETLLYFDLVAEGGSDLIGKGYSDTHYLEALNGLIQRLSLSNPKRQELLNEYNRIKAGNFGEKVVMDSLEQLQLPYQFSVFHDLSLLIESHIQIDILILTKYYAFIFEVKNIKGAIELKENPSQLVRTLSDGEVHVFKSPEPQIEEYIYQLQRFFLNKKIYIPVYGAIIFPFTSSFIKQSSNKTTVLLKNEIKPFLRKIETKSNSITDNELEFLTRSILENHKEFIPYPLMERYNIPREDISNGVLCNKCNTLGMKRTSHYWVCPSCYSKSPTAHEKAIYDYLTIINNKISNVECRKFLKIQSEDQSYRMLKNMNLTKVGKTSGVRYMLPKLN